MNKVRNGLATCYAYGGYGGGQFNAPYCKCEPVIAAAAYPLVRDRGPMGISPIDTQARDNLAFIFDQLGPAYCYIHKLQIRTRIGKEHYNKLGLPVKGSSKTKFHLERINQALGPPDLEYNVHPNGSVMVYVSCSHRPFRLHYEQDVLDIISFLGRVEGRLRLLLSDVRDIVVPLVESGF